MADIDWTQMLSGAGAQDQQAQLDQQLQDVLLRRRQQQSGQYKTGVGAALGGFGDIVSAFRSRAREDELRQQKMQLSQQQAGTRKSYLQELMSAQQPSQAPTGMSPAQQFGTSVMDTPSTGLAPMQDRASAEQGRQQRLQGLQAAGMLSGDPLIQGYVQHQPQMEMQGLQALAERQRLAQTEKMNPLMLQQEQQKVADMGPQAALGGQTPNVFSLLTKRFEAPKAVPLPPGSGVMNARTGEIMTPAGEDRATTRERKKARAALNIGPDLEPTDDLINKVQAGEADPSSPGMKGPLEKLGKLNSAAAGFSDVAQRLKDFLGKHPNGEFAGSDATEAEAIAQDLRSLYMENLNMQTLRSSDIPILNKVIADPTTLSNIFKSSTGMIDLNRQLDTAVNLAKQRSLSQAEALGYQPSKSGRYGSFQPRRDQGGGGAPASPGGVRMQAPDGSTHLVPADKVDAAKAAGGKVL